jgi:hypothetical protein
MCLDPYPFTRAPVAVFRVRRILERLATYRLRPLVPEISEIVHSGRFLKSQTGQRRDTIPEREKPARSG